MPMGRKESLMGIFDDIAKSAVEAASSAIGTARESSGADALAPQTQINDLTSKISSLGSDAKEKVASKQKKTRPDLGIYSVDPSANNPRDRGMTGRQILFDDQSGDVVGSGGRSTMEFKPSASAGSYDDPRKVPPTYIGDRLNDPEFEGMGLSEISDQVRSEQHDDRMNELMGVSDEPESGYKFDEDIGRYVDLGNMKVNEKLDYDEDRRKRIYDKGEDMYKPEEGTYLVTHGGDRTLNGKAVTRDGDNVLLAYLSGKANPLVGAAATPYQEGDLPFLRDLTYGIGDAVLSTQSRINNLREDGARDRAEYKFVTSSGNEYDFDDFDSSDFGDAWERYQSKDLSKVTRREPTFDELPYDRYSGGTFYAYEYDDQGNPVPLLDDDGNQVYWTDSDGNQSPAYKQVEVGKFDGSAEFADSAKTIPIAPGSMNYDTMMYELESGQRVPVVVGDDGSITPQVFARWDVHAENPEDSIAWSDEDEVVVLNNGMEIPAGDFREIMTGQAKRENVNDDWVPSDVIGIDFFDEGFKSIPVIGDNNFWRLQKDVRWTNENGDLDPSLIAQNLIPAAADALLTSLPYMNPTTAALAFGGNLLAAINGLDPMSYDYRNGTYDMPTSMSMDQYYGNIAGVTAENAFDMLLGIGAFRNLLGNIASGTKNAAMKSIGGYTADEIATINAKKAAKEMSRGGVNRLARKANEEGLSEVLPVPFSTLSRGDYGGTYFANQKKDENGNLMWTDGGAPIYDEETQIGDRVRNFLNEAIPSYLLGGIVGGGIGAATIPGEMKRDRAMIDMTGGYAEMPRTIAEEAIVRENLERMRKNNGED